MKLIEIRNNLIKLSYNENERPTLGQFIALTGEEKSYVFLPESQMKYALAIVKWAYSKI